jgi:hypothetical protein
MWIFWKQKTRTIATSIGCLTDSNLDKGRQLILPLLRNIVTYYKFLSNYILSPLIFNFLPRSHSLPTYWIKGSSWFFWVFISFFCPLLAIFFILISNWIFITLLFFVLFIYGFVYGFKYLSSIFFFFFLVI